MLMTDRLTDAQTVGFALTILGVMFAVGWIVRSRIGFLRALFIPSSIIAGFLVLLSGPQVLGRLIHTNGLFPTEVLEIWRVMPGLLINVVFGAIMIGKTLPSPRQLWHAAAPHALFGTFLSLGQFTLAGLVVLFLLGPVFGLPPEAGALLEMSFAGGHGTIAGMGQLLSDAGAPDLVDVGLGLATISMITGIGVGSALVRWAVRSPRVTVMRNVALTAHDDYDVDRVRVAPADEHDRSDEGIHASVLAFALIAAAIMVAIGLLWGLRWVANEFGSDIFDKLPLFPMTVIGGFIVQWVATKSRQAGKIDKRAVNGISAVALDALLVCAIGTMSLAALASNVPAIIVLTLVGVLWSVISLVWLGRRFHRRNWFEHSIADFGQSQGNVATGFVLADMVDPQRRTSTANDYGYKQLAYEPILGGGLITALSVPLITDFGLPAFTGMSFVLLLIVGTWGIRRRGHSAAEDD
jgi:ESS family glutamate:Na+ symporter